MKNTTARRAGLAASAVLVAGSVLAGTAYAAGTPPRQSGSSAVSAPATAESDPETDPGTDQKTDQRAQLEQQRGIVLEGTADLDGLPVMITVYENSLHGNSLQVVVGDPEADGGIGYVEQSEPFVTDGVLDGSVTVGDQPLTLHGTVTSTGRPERLTEPIQDNGEQLVTRGTNQPLAVDATVTYAGLSGQVAFAPAFAYDLEVRRVTLYGGR